MPEFNPLDESTFYPSRQNEDAASGWYPSRDKDDMVKDDRSGEAISNILGKFEYHEIIDIKKSKAADREITRKIPICLTKIRGSVPEDISSHKVTQHNAERWIKRFPEAWSEFLGQEVKVDGTPVTDVEGVTKERAMVLSFDGIRNAEDLATLTDEQCTAKGFGWRQYRDAARELVGAKPTEENQNSAEIDALKEQLAKMQELLQEQTADKNEAAPKRRGRPRKVDSEQEATEHVEA